MKTTFLLLLVMITFNSARAQDQIIEWLDFETAIQKHQESPKKIFIDMYTDWCGWCKKWTKKPLLILILLLICKTIFIW